MKRIFVKQGFFLSKKLSKHIWGLAGLAGLAGAISLTSPALADSGCYIENDRGQVFDLAALCGVTPGGAEPVLQTGDVQVTLRWATSDDLDLVVVGPSGEAVTYFSPTSASGGQLDVDANAFCETASPAPVENIFWPTGGAPTGDYSALVVLSIPCSGPSTTAVDYTLTVLNQGQTTTYEGVANIGAVDETAYPFSLGQ
ncbi:MAG: hypothetical protein AAGC54_16800 [Cyanobacteria bacterium P01_F01_bin.4]